MGRGGPRRVYGLPLLPDGVSFFFEGVPGGPSGYLFFTLPICANGIGSHSAGSFDGGMVTAPLDRLIDPIGEGKNRLPEKSLGISGFDLPRSSYPSLVSMSR